MGTGTSLNVDPSNTTEYYVRGEGGCVTSPGSCGTITITVNMLEFDVLPDGPDGSVCQGSSASYSVCCPTGGSGTWSTDNTSVAVVDDERQCLRRIRRHCKCLLHLHCRQLRYGNIVIAGNGECAASSDC